MTKPLIIVESPAKCKKIETFLDNQYTCLASYGHIRELKDGLKCIDIDNNFKPKFTLISGKNISKLRTAIINATEVLLATDDDREGEAIAWHLCQVFKLNIHSTKRIIFHEVTKSALEHAIKNPIRLDMNKVNAQLARVVLDRLVGFKVSPVLWTHINRNNSLSAGRCQTPALQLVYDNYLEIENSPGREAYDTTGYFTSKNLPFKLDKNHEGQEAMEAFLEESVNHEHKFERKPANEQKRKPPTPFTTSTLQQTASNILHFSPKQTMTIAQKLYENGYITYMRTDSKTYSKEFIESMKGYIKSEYGEKYVNPDILSLCLRKKMKENKKKKDDNKVQEAHEAIRPTKITLTQLKDHDAKERKLYHLIWKNTIQSGMSDEEYYLLQCIISAAEKTQFKYSTEQVIFPGWKIVEQYEKENPLYQYLMKIVNGSTLPYKKMTCKFSLKELKQHYTEARLVQLLENKGIGRPSTFSSLIAKIQERSYVSKENIKGKERKCTDYELIDDEIEEIETTRNFGNEKNKLVLQPMGKLVIEFLSKHFHDLFKYEYTSEMERRLDVIADGNYIWYDLCKECYDEVIELSKQIKELDNTKQIDEHHRFIIGKYGPCIEYKEGKERKYYKIKKGINIEHILDYKLEDIIERNSGHHLGKYNNEDIYLKDGRYGPYVTYNNKSISVKNIEEKTLENIIPLLSDSEKKSSEIKHLNSELSLRNGKYGYYIFYKTQKMKKPKFLSLKGCSLSIEESSNQEYLEWIKQKYNI